MRQGTRRHPEQNTGVFCTILLLIAASCMFTLNSMIETQDRYKFLLGIFAVYFFLFLVFLIPYCTRYFLIRPKSESSTE